MNGKWNSFLKIRKFCTLKHVKIEPDYNEKTLWSQQKKYHIIIPVRKGFVSGPKRFRFRRHYCISKLNLLFKIWYFYFSCNFVRRFSVSVFVYTIIYFLSSKKLLCTRWLLHFSLISLCSINIHLYQYSSYLCLIVFLYVFAPVDTCLTMWSQKTCFNNNSYMELFLRPDISYIQRMA